MLRSIAAECECSCSRSRSALRCVSKDEDGRARAELRLIAEPFAAFRFHDVKQPISFPRRVFCARALQLCFAHPNRGGGRSAERRSGAAAPVGRIMCVKDARERAYDAIRQALARRLASHDAGRSPLGAPPWRFWAPGAALPSPSAPAVLQRRAVALRIRRASSSHPGRSAWRAGSLPPEANGYEPPPQDATPRSAFRMVSRTRPQ